MKVQQPQVYGFDQMIDLVAGSSAKLQTGHSLKLESSEALNQRQWKLKFTWTSPKGKTETIERVLESSKEVMRSSSDFYDFKIENITPYEPKPGDKNAEVRLSVSRPLPEKEVKWEEKFTISEGESVVVPDGTRIIFEHTGRTNVSYADDDKGPHEDRYYLSFEVRSSDGKGGGSYNFSGSLQPGSVKLVTRNEAGKEVRCVQLDLISLEGLDKLTAKAIEKCLNPLQNSR